MCAFVCLMIILGQLLFDYRIFQSLIAPPIILDIMWGGVHLINFICGIYVDDPLYLVFAIPTFMFNFGFLLAYRNRLLVLQPNRICKNHRILNKKYNVFEIRLSIAVILDLVLLIVYLVVFWKSIDGVNYPNLWLRIHEFTFESGVILLDILVSYSYPYAYILSAFCGINWYQNKNRKNFIFYILTFGIGIVRAFFAGNRTSLFMVFVINLFSIILYEKNKKNVKLTKKEKRTIVITGILIVLIFLIVGTQKYSEEYRETNKIEFIVKNLTGYFNISSIGFLHWYKRGFKYTYGVNSMRFFFAIFARIGFDVEVANTISGSDYVIFDYLGDVRTTNAYTVLKTYVQDFGFLYAAIMLCLFGFVHGLLYKLALEKKGRDKVSASLCCSCLYVSLLYQVLTDQYLNVLSIMLQFFIWSVVFTKIILKDNNINLQN